MAPQAIKLLLVLAVVVMLTAPVHSKVFYVSSSQNGGKRSVNNKLFDKTLGKVQDCIDNLKEPGDECVIQPGTYHETVTIANKHGTKESPIIIRGSPDGVTKMDGTIPLTPAKWEKMPNGAYKGVIYHDVTQLFIDEQMMTNARWPNALWSDKTVFDSQYWAKSSKKSKRGLMIDGGEHKLAESGINATGAMAVLNVGSFCTFTREVLSHNKDRFTYQDANKELGKKLNFKPKNNQYFLESKLEFLDNPGEWFYEKKNGFGILYVMTTDGNSPEGRDVRGKVKPVSFNITDCKHVIFKDITFFATTMQARSSSKKNYNDQLVFHSLNFSYPSYNRRMLRDTTPPQRTEVVSGKGSVRFFNNTFYGTDGIALKYQGIGDVVENNLFEYNDWSGANMNVATGGGGTVYSNSIGDKFIRNTLRYNGATVGYRSGYESEAKLNDISRQCWGMIAHDGAGMQVQVKRQTKLVFEQNWIHDSPKYGLRFDGEPKIDKHGVLKIGGKYGTMRRNVIRKTNGMMVKGDYHTVDHNLVFHKYSKHGDADGQSDKCNLCVLRYVRKNPVPINHNTVVEYNAADIANGGVHNKKLYPMSGILKDNVIGDVRAQLMDPDNMDFRPRNGSLYNINGVGPYDITETKKKYWIPGRKMYKASNPVPPDNSTSVKASSRDVLMWLNSFEGDAHVLFLGTKADDLVEQGEAANENNVVKILQPLESGLQYFWRVDVKVGGKVKYTGDVWSFKTIE
ncbi:hypothetical protein ACROYT_G026469 [Oculina patagonica]